MSINIKIVELVPNHKDAPCNSTYIYKLFFGGTCVYVGQTNNLRNRVYQHLADGKQIDNVEAFLCSTSDRYEIEALEIVKEKPKFNKNLPKNRNFRSLGNLRESLNKKVRSIDDKKRVVFQSRSDNRPLSYIERKRYDEILQAFDLLIKAVNRGEDLAGFIALGE